MNWRTAWRVLKVIRKHAFTILDLIDSYPDISERVKATFHADEELQAFLAQADEVRKDIREALRG